MSDSIGMVGAAATAGPTRPGDSKESEIYSKEERIALWKRSLAESPARKADRSFQVSLMPPAERASMEAAMARTAKKLRQAQESGAFAFFSRIMEWRARTEEGNPDGGPPAPESMLSRFPHLRAGDENTRRSLLDALRPGSLIDSIREEVNDEAAEATFAQIGNRIHDLDRRLGRPPTDLSGRYPAMDDAPMNLRV